MASGMERPDAGDSEQDEEEDVYEVERIIDMRVEEGEVLYRVRWKNYTSDDDTWEPEAHLEDCREVLLAYKKCLAENKAKRDSVLLLSKNDLFNAGSDSSDVERRSTSPTKKKKKKKKLPDQVDEDDEEDLLVKEKKKKKKKWKEDKPLPAPETDEEEDETLTTRSSSPPPNRALESKRRMQESDDSDAPVASKKHKKEGKLKDVSNKHQKKEIMEDFPRKKKKDKEKEKKKSKKNLESSEDEGSYSEVAADSLSVASEEAAVTSKGKLTSADKERSQQGKGDEHRVKQKKSKSEVKQGLKELMLDKKTKKPEGSGSSFTSVPKDSSASKLKNNKTSRGGSGSTNEDDSDAKVRNGKGQESTNLLQKAPSSSASSVSSAASTSVVRSKEEEGRGDAADKDKEKDRSAANLFEEFLLNCEAKDRVQRRPGTGPPTGEKSTTKSDKKSRPVKESPARRPDTDRAKDASRSGQSPSIWDPDTPSDTAEQRDDTTGRSRSDERRERPTPAGMLLEEEERRRRERLDGEDDRWRERRRKKTDGDDNHDMQDSLDRPDKTPDRSQCTLNLGVDINLDWMTLEDFQKHLNGEDEILSAEPLSPGELREAVKSGDYIAVKLAIASDVEYNLDQEDSSGMSLMMLAAAGGHDDILRLLLKKGVKVNARQKNGSTALMHAAEKNFLTTAAILLEAGCYVNTQTLGGETALMKACKRGNADVVRLLLEYGADCNIQSKHKNTAMQCAKTSNNLVVYDFIKEHINTLSTVAEETIRAYFETRLALLEPVFPLACHRLCEGPDFSLDFNYKPPAHNPGEGSGILLFIFHANFLNDITARLCGPCSVHAVVLNDKFQLPIFLDSHFIYSFSPVLGANKLFIRLAEAPTAKVKLLICAYRVQLQ